jgi:cyclopropane-fatty-acyl-phospholipid synthase
MSTASRLLSVAEGALGPGVPVRIRAWDGSVAGPSDAPELHVKSRRALRRLVWQPGELGIAQAYVTGEVDVTGGAHELARGLRALWQHARVSELTKPRISPRTALTAVALGALGRRPPAPVTQARLDGELHSRKRDSAAISHHYDLSNEFYELILDESMAYSCAVFDAPDASIDDAQRTKLDLICRKLGLEPGMRLLDVGCGWGSLSLHAAEHFGVQVLGVTISTQQREHIEKRIAARGLSGSVEVRLQDYRELDERPFDAVSSIEMGEHVGEGNYPRYVAALYSHLRPGGHLLLQQMSRRADSAPGGGPFIESYIAPDMHMRPLPATLAFLEAAGFEIRDVEALREHYVTTVDWWLDKFEENYETAVAMVGEEMARVWRLYLVGGGLSFEEGRMGVDQILARRPRG